MMPKPKDDSTRYWMSRLGLAETDTWPPRRKFGKEPRGHVFWPKHIKGDATQNNAHLGQQFGKALNDLYWSGDSITFVDDAYVIAAMYGLRDELDTYWTMGRSNNSSLWTSFQKPSGTHSGGASSFAYNQPTHIFFGRDNNQANLDKIADIAISQLDPREIMELVKSLPVHRFGESAVSEMLYINRSGPYLAQIGV